MFGMSGEGLPAGMDALAAIHPSDHARIKRNIEKLVRGDPFDDHEYTAVRPDGSTFPVAVYSVPIRKSGQVCGFRGIMVDISERKKAEDAVRESEEKFRTLFNNASDAIYIHGLMPDGSPGQFIEVNEIMCSRLGYTRDELLLMTVRDIVSDAHRKKMGAIRNEMVTTGHFTFLAEHQRKDGTVFPVEVNSRRFILKDKSVVLAVARDITVRTALESEIRQQHRQLKNIMENLPAGVFRATASQSLKWVMANPILARIFGYDSVGDFLKSSPLELFADPKTHNSIIDRLIRDGAVSNTEVQMKRKDGGMLWISLSAVAVPGPGGAPEFFDGMLADITARKTAEVALLEANQKLKLLNSLTRHDVRNQLMLLKGFVQLMAAKDHDPGISDYLKKIQRITETISSQIEFTKAYQELGINAPGWLLLGDVIEKTATPLAVTLSDACRRVEIFADPMLEQVFFNLYENAFRHGQKATQIQVRCEHEGDQLRIMVEDDGVGIPAEHKEKIFKKGFGRNTGLGLFLSREILAITGITIRETGTPGNGARFEMDVPKDMFRNVP
jgi:PAS domain S-box-containing protein